MFVLVALVYHLSTTLAAPVPSNQALAVPDPANTRALRDIVVSCLTTIFLCTWVSMHPNIPAPMVENRHSSFWTKTWWSVKKFVRRSLPTFLVSLCFPEYIIGWAIRQRLTAAKHVKHMGDPEFTITHAFFVIMGGVHKKTENGSFPLDRYQVSSLLGVEIDPWSDVLEAKGGKQKIQLPSEAELQDKSKSDWLAKLGVVIQTLWFVTQCIARGIEGLPVTEIEVITLAYAVLNFAIYIAWWDKPSWVDCPIVITADVEPERKKDKSHIFERMVSYIMGDQDDECQLSTQNEVPNFYNGDPEASHLIVASFISFLLGAAFGAVHCIDWRFAFASIVEQRLWRISSLVLTGISFGGAILMAIIRVFGGARNHVWEKWMDIVDIPLGFTSPLLVFSYLAARITTVYIAFHSLQSLPSEAFIAVQWTGFIPHI